MLGVLMMLRAVSGVECPYLIPTKACQLGCLPFSMIAESLKDLAEENLSSVACSPPRLSPCKEIAPSLRGPATTRELAIVAPSKVDACNLPLLPSCKEIASSLCGPLTIHEPPVVVQAKAGKIRGPLSFPSKSASHRASLSLPLVQPVNAITKTSPTQKCGTSLSSDVPEKKKKALSCNGMGCKLVGGGEIFIFFLRKKFHKSSRPKFVTFLPHGIAE